MIRFFQKKIRKLRNFYLFRVLTPLIARDVIQQIRSHSEKALFIDCGSNLGQGFNFFKKHFPKEYFDYELFEPNPNCLNQLEKLKDSLPDYSIVIHKEAISTKKSTLKFYGLVESNGGGALSQGGSILKDHNSKQYDANENKAITVQAINFGSYLKEKLKRYRTIIIKMDIEGAEYSVLNDLIDRGLAKNINVIFCEFHSQYMTDEKRQVYKQKEFEIINKMRALKCKFILWI